MIMFQLNRIPKPRYMLMALLLVASVAVGACSGSTGEVITDIQWEWTELVETEPASQSLVPTPELYTLLLKPDGTLNIQADCNMVGGSYTRDGNSLTIELGPSTMVYCGDQSLDQHYLELLSRVERYAVADGQLVLSLRDGAGTMTFDQK